MNPFKADSEKLLFWFTVLVAMVIVLLISHGDLVSVGITGAILALLACAVYGAFKQLPPTWSKRIFYGCVIGIVPFGIFGGIEAGKRVPWPNIFIENGASMESKKLDGKIAQAKAARAVAEKKEDEEAAQEAQKNIALAVQNFAGNIASVSDKIDALQKSTNEQFELDHKQMKIVVENVIGIKNQVDDLQKSTDERFEQDRKQMELLEKDAKANENLLRGLIAPSPPAESESVAPPEKSEITVPPLPEPLESETVPPLEWKPVPRRTVPKQPVPVPAEPKKKAPLPPKAIPKPEEIRPAEPQPRIEHHAKAAEPEQKRLVAKCNCGKAHPVRGFWHFPNGASIPDYTHCSDEFGRPCLPQSYEQVVVRK